MKLLEDDYLGGSGSRGYGKVRFTNMKIVNKPKEYYEGDKSAKKEEKDINNLDDLINKLDKVYNY